MEQELEVTVEAIQPLLMSNPVCKTNTADSGRGKKEVPTREEEAEARAYRLPDGQLFIPAAAFRASLLAAAGAYRVGIRGLKGLLAHIRIEPEFVPLVDADGKPIKDYTIDVRRVVLTKMGKKVSISRARPRIEFWRATFRIVYDTELVGKGKEDEHLRTPLADAGSRIGVCDFRPQCNGWFGRFKLMASG